MLNISLFLVGLFILIKSAINYLTFKDDNPISLVFFAVSITACLPMLMTPLDWDRYYLLPVFFSTIVISVGIGWLTVLGFRAINCLLQKDYFNH